MNFLLPSHQVKEGTAEDPANDLSFSSRKDLSENRHPISCAVLPPASRSAFMPARAKSSTAKDSTAHLGFEARLWLPADRRSEAETAKAAQLEVAIRANPGRLNCTL